MFKEMRRIKKFEVLVFLFCLSPFFVTGCGPKSSMGGSSFGSQTVTINNIDFDVSAGYQFFTWNDLPSDVRYERQPVKTFTNQNGDTHYYEVVYVPSGNLNWFQAARLAQDAGGYMVSITGKAENTFVFNLVSDQKYFWKFPKYTGRDRKRNHYEISIGPFIGGYQPVGSREPASGWSWLSGEKWQYSNWAVNLDDGVVDKDPRRNTQPNNSGNSKYGQRIMGFGEMNLPVPTWGDYMDDVSTYGKQRTPGKSYGFIIEYEKKP